jgi:hypothetical protein
MKGNTDVGCIFNILKDATGKTMFLVAGQGYDDMALVRICDKEHAAVCPFQMIYSLKQPVRNAKSSATIQNVNVDLSRVIFQPNINLVKLMNKDSESFFGKVHKLDLRSIRLLLNNSNTINSETKSKYFGPDM